MPHADYEPFWVQMVIWHWPVALGIFLAGFYIGIRAWSFTMIVWALVTLILVKDHLAMQYGHLFLGTSALNSGGIERVAYDLFLSPGLTLAVFSGFFVGIHVKILLYFAKRYGGGP